MSILLYIGTVLLSTTQATLGKLVGGEGNQTAFNLCKSVAALVMFSVFGIFSFSFNVPTLIYGTVFGVFLYLATWSSLSAFICGPMALTSMIASFSLIIPCTYGIAFLEEPCTLFTVCGFVLLSAAFILISYKKKNDKAISAKWLIITVITLITNGICSLIMKLHQIDFPEKYQNDFMIYAYLVASIMFVIELLIKQNKSKCFDIKGVLAGLANGGGNYLTIYLASGEDASIMFPIISVLTAVTALSAGRLIFKEKLSLIQIIGFAFGIASVVLLKL